MVTIAVASDLHAAETGSQESFLIHGAPRTPWKQHPIEALRRLIIAESLSADYLVCPGDFTNRCCAPGFQAGWDAIEELAGYLQAQVVGTIGNHDVDSRNEHGYRDPFALAKSVSARFPVGDVEMNADFWANGFTIKDDGQVTFLVINSAIEHSDPVAAEHGSVSDELRANIEDALDSRNLSSLRIAVVHHHPYPHEDFNLGARDIMHGGSQLAASLAARGFQLIIHGHKHHPKLSYGAGDTSSIVVFAAGSLTKINYATLASNTRNLFHIISIAPSAREDCSVCGSIRSWEFNAGDRWNPATLRSAHFPFYAGFGCRSTADQLANSIVNVVTGRCRWRDVEASVPCVAYALPSTREAVLTRLNARNIRVLRDDIGEPSEVAPVGN